MGGLGEPDGHQDPARRTYPPAVPRRGLPRQDLPAAHGAGRRPVAQESPAPASETERGSGGRAWRHRREGGGPSEARASCAAAGGKAVPSNTLRDSLLHVLFCSEVPNEARRTASGPFKPRDSAGLWAQ